MSEMSRQRRILIGVGLGGGLCACWLVGVLGWWVAEAYSAADYPGALPVANHSLYRLSPMPNLRRDTSYRSTDDFPRLYNWYSRRFSLGPEAGAASACITMQKADSVLLLHRETTVVICDAGSDRLIFVTRIFGLRWR